MARNSYSLESVWPFDRGENLVQPARMDGPDSLPPERVRIVTGSSLESLARKVALLESDGWCVSGALTMEPGGTGRAWQKMHLPADKHLPNVDTTPLFTSMRTHSRPPHA